MVKQKGLAWYRRSPGIAIVAASALVVGVGIGAAGDGSDQVATDLAADVTTLERELEQSVPIEERDELVSYIDELENELDAAQSELAKREGELADRETELAQREADLDELESSLGKREEELADREQDAQEPVTPSETQGGCSAGQVDINTAGVQELQRIHEIGPDRAQQIVALRPFRSVDDLTRVSGIAEARLGSIQAQGVACVG